MLGLADAADVEVDALAEVVDRGRRRDELQLVDRRDAAVGDVLAGHHRRRDRRLLQVGAAPLGGDDDFVELLGLLVFALIGGRLRPAGKDVAICAAANADARSIFFIRFPLCAPIALPMLWGGVSHPRKSAVNTHSHACEYL